MKKIVMKWISMLLIFTLINTSSVYAAIDILKEPAINQISNDSELSVPIASDSNGIKDESTIASTSQALRAGDVPRYEDNIYYVSTAEHLKWVSESVSKGTNGFEGKIIRLENDINLVDEWIPIGNDELHPFKGSIDGNNHTIYNLSISNHLKAKGFIGYMEINSPCTIVNITFKNLFIEAKRSGAGDFYTGGLIGNLVNKSGKEFVIKNCNIMGFMWVEKLYPDVYTGGIIGKGTTSNNSSVVIEQCKIDLHCAGYADMTNSVTGGIIGDISLKDTSKLRVSSCFSAGKITASGPSLAIAGGIIGNALLEKTSVLEVLNSGADCFTEAAAWYGYCNAYTGGIIGKVSGGNVNMKECYKKGEVNTPIENSGSGGLIGYSSSSTIDISDSYVQSIFSFNSGINGGIIGKATGKTTIRNCYITGETSGYSAGIIGSFSKSGDNTLTVENCFFNKDSLNIPSNHLVGYKYSDWYTEGITNSTGLSEKDMLKSESYRGWDFVEVWGISYDKNNGYPYLSLVESYGNPSTFFLKIKDSLGNPISGATAIFSSISYISDINGIIRLDTSTFSREELNDFFSVSKENFLPVLKKLCDIGIDSNAHGVGIITLEPDLDKSLPYIDNASIYDEMRLGFHDISTVERIFTTSGKIVGGGDASPLSSIYAHVNWRGNAPGDVWLVQEHSNKKIKFDDDYRINIALGEFFKPELPIYIYAETADGKKGPNYMTRLLIRKSVDISDKSKGKISIGKNFTTNLGTNIPILCDSDFGFIGPDVPWTISVDGNNFKIQLGFKEKSHQADKRIWDKYCQDIDEMYKSADNYNDFSQKIYKLKQQGYTSGISSFSKKGNISAPFEVIGYIEGFINNGKLCPTRGKVIAKAMLKYSKKTQYVFGTIPIVGELGGSISAEPSITVSEVPFEDISELALLGDATIATSINLGAGPGIANFLNVMLNGNVTAPINFHLAENNEDTGIKFSLKGSMKIKAQALIFTYEWTCLEREWVFIDTIDSKNILRQAEYDTQSIEETIPTSYTLMNRDYTSNPSMWKGSSVHVTRRSLQKAESSILKTNIYPYAKPKLVSYNDQKVLFWIDDDISRNDINRTSLMFSICDSNGKWSRPRYVNDDGTADFDYDVCFDGDKLYVFWQNAKMKYENTDSLEELSKGLQLSVSTFDETTNTFTVPVNISSDYTMTFLPRIAANGQKVLLIWGESSGSNYFMMDGENKIYTAEFTNEHVSNKRLVSSELCPITELDGCIENSDVAIAYVIDSDGDIKTTTDLEIKVYKNYNISTITENTDLDGNIKFASFGGQNSLFYYSEDRIYSIEAPFDVPPKELILQGEISIASAFDIITSEEEAAIIYETGSIEGENRQLCAVIYDSETDTWSNQSQVTNIDKEVFGSNGFIDKDGNWNLSFLTFMNEQTDLSILQFKPSCELQIISNGDYDFDDVTPEREVPISFRVKNVGKKVIDGIVVSIEDETGSTNQEIEVRIQPGEARSITADYLMPDIIIPQTLHISAAPMESDIDQNMNVIDVNIGYPDIAVDDVTVLCNGDHRSLNVKVKNMAYENVKDIKIAVSSQKPDGLVVAKEKISALDSGMDWIVNIELDDNLFSNTDNDTEVFYVTVSSEMEELFKTNNYYMIGVSNPKYIATDKPPIQAKSVHLDWANIDMKEGETKQLTATILPINTENKSLIWYSSNDDIVHVDPNGYVTAKKEGSASISVQTCEGAKIASCPVQVSATGSNSEIIIPVTSLSINYSDLKLVVGENKLLKATLLPYNATNQTIFWSSEAPGIVGIKSNGEITAYQKGTALVWAASESGDLKACCMVTVTQKSEPSIPVAVTGVTLDQSVITLKIGNSFNLNAHIAPDNATNKSVRWLSTSPKVASIDQYGKVSALKEGTSNIYVITKEGNYKAFCLVNVEDDKSSSGGGNSGGGSSGGGGSSSPGHSSVGPQLNQFPDTYPGAMWQAFDNGRWKLLKTDGSFATGWARVKNLWYYMELSTAFMKTGWFQDSNGKFYYLMDSGAMAIGWFQIDGGWYYFNTSGIKLNNWIKTNNNWYYLDLNGKMLKDCITPDGYKLDATGVWIQ